MARKKTMQNVKQSGLKSTQFTLWLSIGFVTLVILSLPSVLILFFGLLPTIVAFIVDRSKGRNAAFCVGGINFCGVFPYLMDLWNGDNSIDMSVRILTDVFSLVIMYGAAGFGWMLYLTLAPIFAAFISVIAQHKISILRTTQRQLIEEWGEDVSTSQEVLNMREEIATNEEIDLGASQLPEQLDVNDFLKGIDSILEKSPPPAEPTGPTEDNVVSEESDMTKQPPRPAIAGT